MTSLIVMLQTLRRHPDWLLTLLTAVLTLMIFVFAPLQAAGFALFQAFAIAGLLVMISGALAISGNPIALGFMFIAFTLNVAVFSSDYITCGPIIYWFSLQHGS